MLTIGDYIKGKLSLWSIDYPEANINIELAKIGLSPNNIVTENTNIDLFFYNVIPDILMRPTNISEGGFSISFNADTVYQYYLLLCRKLNKPDLTNKNTITDITSKW